MSELNPAAEAAARGAAEDGVEVEAPSEPPPETRAGMDGIRDELTKLRLQMYAPEFELNGYDVWEEVLRLPPHRLAKLIELVNFSSNHADRFKEYVRDERRRRGIGQVMPRVPGRNEPDGFDPGMECAIL